VVERDGKGWRGMKRGMERDGERWKDAEMESNEECSLERGGERWTVILSGES
jgi:hypothetical protein